MPSDTLSELRVTWLIEDHFHYSNAYAAVALFRGEIPVTEAANPDASLDSPEYVFDVDGEADWDLTDLNVDGRPLPHTTLKAKLVELQDACRRLHLIVSSLLSEIVDLAH